MGIERICTPRPARGTRESKCAGFTTRMSVVTASMTNSAVFPMKNLLRPERETTPIRNPLAGGEEIEVHMVYPKGGILWNDGNIVTTSTMQVTHDALQMRWPGKFAVIAEVSWTNSA